MEGMKMSSGDKWCKHRTAFTSEFKTCKVGVDFHAFKPPMPCLGEDPAAALARCAQFEAHTPEELAAREAERDARMKRFGVIRPAIVENVKKTGIRSGSIPCPACKTGNVRYSQSSYNDHIHATCSTPNCASWME